MKKEGYYERRTPTLYRFLRVQEESLTVVEMVRFPCCGAKRSIKNLGEMDLEMCIHCATPHLSDPRTAPLEQEKDMANFRHLKVSRYVS